jgi:glycine cleavage system H protein
MHSGIDNPAVLQLPLAALLLPSLCTPMSQVPDHLRFRDTHEWISAAENPASVGISDHAQAELTDIVFVELPKVGRVVKAGEQVAVVESVKAASDIYSPVSGEVVAINDALLSDPGLINREPYAAGWMFKVSVSDAGQVAALMDASGYKAHIG